MSPHRDFCSTEHLGPEAVAAFVDHELSPAATRRAQDHIAQCAECHEEVVAQRGASQRMRSLCADEEMKAPTVLVERLTRICEANAEANAEREAQRAAHREAANGGSISRVERALKALRRRG